MTQDAQLFSGTIRENLLFVNPRATDADCMEVLRKAACQSLLARADKGLDTLIGEGGVKVSGGEKQRLSIARALLRRPNLLVFDEATSALDSLTEEEISETIRDVSTRKDLITILIAHRLSTVMHADRIYVLERGHVIESGGHDELSSKAFITPCGVSKSANATALAYCKKPEVGVDFSRRRCLLVGPTKLTKSPGGVPDLLSCVWHIGSYAAHPQQFEEHLLNWFEVHSR